MSFALISQSDSLERRDESMLSWRSSTGPTAGVVRVVGGLGFSGGLRLAQALRETARHTRLVVLDLRGLTSVDRAGVLSIVKASSSVQRAGGRLVLIRGLAKFDRLLARTGRADAIESIDLAAGVSASSAISRIAHEPTSFGPQISTLHYRRSMGTPTEERR
jgi:anti-anti-sigma regulatory factor